MLRKPVLLPVIIILVFTLLIVMLVSSCAPPTSTAMFGDRIGLLYVEGVIMSGGATDDLFGSQNATSDSIVETIGQAIDDPGIRAIVVRINSPGGSAAASQEIYDAFKRFSDTGRPVIVSMADVAASGGYYIAAPADEIFANPATLTGSIGVIMQLLNYEGLLDWANVYDETIKSGEFKDIGSAMRPMTPEERELLQDMLDQVHDQFKEAVMEGRGYTREEIDEIATGMIWNGEDALELGLIDKLGGLQDAIDRASDLAGLGENPVIDEIGQTGLFDQFFEDMGYSSQFAPESGNPLLDLLNQGFSSGQNPLFRLYSLALLDTRFVGSQSGIMY